MWVLFLKSLHQNKISRGTWVTQLVECLLLDFDSYRDPRGMDWALYQAPCWMWSLLKILFLPLSFSLLPRSALPSLCLCLSNKKIKFPCHFMLFLFVAQDECSIAVFLKVGPQTPGIPKTFRGSFCEFVLFHNKSKMFLPYHS